jgi:hypothetical protein
VSIQDLKIGLNKYKIITVYANINNKSIISDNKYSDFKGMILIKFRLKRIQM